MTITDPYKEIHALREKLAKMYDEYAGIPSERIRHMEEVAELREENQKLAAEKSEILRMVDGLNSANNRYRKALEEAAADLSEASIEIADWGTYASDYFQKKHDLVGTVKRVSDQAMAAQRALDDE